MAVVIVNYNTRDELRECLTTVTAEAPAQVIVVDNASQDGSAEMVTTEFPDVTLLANALNRGFGAAANQGIRASDTPYALVLNSDTRLQPGSTAVLVRDLDAHPEAAIVGPCLLNADGTVQASCFPFLTPLNVVFLHTYLNSLLSSLPLVRRPLLRALRPVRPQPVPWLKGAALAIRRAAFAAVEGFDETFFMYAEDADLCYRMRRAGWDIRFTPLARVVHVGGASTMHTRPAMVAREFDSLEHLCRLHRPRGEQVRLRWAIVLVMLEHIARDRVRRLWMRDPEQCRRVDDDRQVWLRILKQRLRSRR